MMMREKPNEIKVFICIKTHKILYIEGNLRLNWWQEKYFLFSIFLHSQNDSKNAFECNGIINKNEIPEYIYL